MLLITIPASESWDERKEEFVTTTEERTLQLEHSLVSISKWESKWHKPFMTKEAKTDEEIIDYIRCMTITQNVSPDTYNRLTPANIDQIQKYISDPMTATVFYNDTSQAGKAKIITSELIYYWMVSLNIPMECQKWHINRLITLIRVCQINSSTPKKMSKKEAASKYAALNAARRKQTNTTG